MTFEGRLTYKSKRRIIFWYSLLVMELIVVDRFLLQPTVIVSELIRDRPWRFHSFWSKGTVLFTIVVVSVSLVLCCYVCAGYVLIFALINVFWEQLKKICPFRIKRRTLCFCNYSLKPLGKILRTIHNTECDSISNPGELLDDTSSACVLSVVNETSQRLDGTSLSYRLVGSSAEGLGKPYTVENRKGFNDAFKKFLLRFFCCCCPCATSYSSLRTDIDIILECTDRHVIRPDSTKNIFQHASNQSRKAKPGFTRLVFNPNTSSSPWSKLSKTHNGRTYLSSKLVKDLVCDVVNGTPESVLPFTRAFGFLMKNPTAIELEIKGPAVKLAIYPLATIWYWNENQKLVTFEGDFVFGIHCFQEWPECAKNWPTRQRNWPTRTTVQKVLESGFMLVAKSSACCPPDEEDLEWLISFPHAESYLSQFIPRVARACYLALKLVFKDHLQYHCSGLKTYHLKTILLFELEKKPVDYWKLENVEECFLGLLDSLYGHVRLKYCPNYWIDGLNLFQEGNSEEFIDLLTILTKVRLNPSPYIEDLGSLWC